MTNHPLRAAFTAMALTLALPACAQTPAPAPDTTHPALWVAKDADTTIYLFGTVHVLKPGLPWFDEAVRAAFDRSGEVVLELVQPDTATMQGIVAAHAVTPPAAPTLSSTLTEPQRAAYAKAMAEVGVPLAAFEHVKPWFAALNLSLLPLMKAGFDPANGPESVITAAAKTANKPVSGLETADQQIGYFDALSPKAQVAFLTSTIDEMPKAQAEMATMVADWAKGDPKALAALMNDDLKASPEIADLLLYRRNLRWAEWLANRMKTPGTVFVAVGAGHLAGKGSVIDDLAAKGVRVMRVKY
ncbi:TraB/GumN family protein [Sphingomonas bacterium]|uniref:TraB/GumN family protein n=1 Tax=Sphingomonas bacterium TaxID=1895847 RepID=UPI0015753EDF|nr:TraB/GumN family protein [Sphingomonas bacterium]